MQRTENSRKVHFTVSPLFGFLLAAGLVSAGTLMRPARAQDADAPDNGALRLPDDGGYQDTDNAPVEPANDDRYAATSDPHDVNDRLSNTYAVTDELDAKTGIGKGDPDAGPVRMARFSLVNGNVTWRRSDAEEWSDATVNLPLRQDAQIWVTEGGRAEIQFDDGSMLRLGRGALVTLQTLYSDTDGEFTEVKLSNGLVWLTLKHDHSIYQIDTPFVSVKSVGPARVRVGAVDNVEVAVKEGQATVDGNQGKITVERGDYLNLRDENDQYVLTRLPRADGWERWNDERDQNLDDAERRPAHEYLPPNQALVAPDLDNYGTWHDDEEYGHVWSPRVEDTTWRPYYNGSWTWVEPFGWTWVSNEPWGWAPYHYGTWISRPYGWAWCPGPALQYWSPAVVNFCEYDGRVAWCPLSPREIRYPSVLDIGIRNRNWSLYFSIGGCGVYYPHDDGFAYGRSWHSGYVNRVHVTNITNITNIYNGPITNTYRNRPFVPFNARNGGVSVASTSGFGGHGRYQPLGRGAEATNVFEHGRPIGAPAANQRPFAGPIGARPTTVSLTPNRTFHPDVHPGQTQLGRPVFRAPLQPSIARVASPVPATTNRANPSGRTFPGRGGNLPATGLPGTGRRGTPLGSTDGAPVLNALPGAGRTFPGRGTDTSDTTSPANGGRRFGRPGYGNGNPFNNGSNPADAARQARQGLGQPTLPPSAGLGTAGVTPSAGMGTAGRVPGRNGYYGGSPVQRPEFTPNVVPERSAPSRQQTPVTVTPPVVTPPVATTPSARIPDYTGTRVYHSPTYTPSTPVEPYSRPSRNTPTYTPPAYTPPVRSTPSYTPPVRNTPTYTPPAYTPPVRSTPSYTAPAYTAPSQPATRPFGYGGAGYGHSGYGTSGNGNGGYGGSGYSAPRQPQYTPPSAPVVRSAPAPAPARTQPAPAPTTNNSNDQSNRGGRRR